MKHHTHNMIKNAIIILAASSVLSIASYSYADGDGQGVTYADDTPSQQTYQCKVSQDSDKVVQLFDNYEKTLPYRGCSGINRYWWTTVVTTDDQNKVEFDQSGNPLSYVQVYSKVINTHKEKISSDGDMISAYLWDSRESPNNGKNLLETYCAPVECVYDNADSSKLYTCTDSTGGIIAC